MQKRLSWKVGIAILAVSGLILVVLTRRPPTPQEIFRRHVGVSVSEGVRNIKVQESNRIGFAGWSEIFIGFTIESNTFQRILHEQGWNPRYGEIFSRGVKIPSWFEGIRTQNFGYMRVRTNRWFFVGPRRFQAELLCCDDDDNAYYYRTK